VSAQTPSPAVDEAPTRRPDPPPLLARKTALLVHALATRDREWLYGHLPDSERASVQALVTELESLGIPADATLLDEVRGATGAARPKPRDGISQVDGPESLQTERRGDTDLEALDGADPDVLASILADEPPGLIAVLLSLREWPWYRDLLQQLDVSRRLQIENQLGRRIRVGAVAGGTHTIAGTGDALRDHLVSRLLKRVSDGSNGRGIKLRPRDGSSRHGTHAADRQALPRLSRLFGKGSRA
jgi:hypothetical protein